LQNKQVVPISVITAIMMYLNINNGIELFKDESLINFLKLGLGSIFMSILVKKVQLPFEKDADLTALNACKDKNLACSALTNLHRLIDKYWPGALKQNEDLNKKTFNLLKDHPDLDERVAYIQAAQIS